MSYEHILEPARRLEYAWEKMHHKDMELQMLKMGETFSLDTFSEKLRESN
ncbi:hypothetical protein ACFL9T_19300 [Thermodesulfobacteriota bacterium]